MLDILLFKVRDVIKNFSVSWEIRSVQQVITHEKCIFYMAYLTDFFGFLNVLNIKLQGYTNILKLYDTIQVFF